MAKTMYVVQAEDGMFYCGMKYWDKQLRKAKIYHSWNFANDIADAYKECNCKIIEVSLAIVQKPMTNGDRIRAMSDEGLAEFNNFCPFIDEECTMKGCNACILEWLKQPAEIPEQEISKERR